MRTKSVVDPGSNFSLNDAVCLDCEVVMNHMANEFYFEGHKTSQAPWRFHEDGGLREYLLKARKAAWLR